MAIKHLEDKEDLSKVLAAYPNYLDVFLKVALDTFEKVLHSAWL